MLEIKSLPPQTSLPLPSSSNPWVLAELQQTLQHAAFEHEDLAEDQSVERHPAEGSQELSPETSPREVIVVRVALPSAAERNQVRARRAPLGVRGAILSACVVQLVCSVWLSPLAPFSRVAFGETERLPGRLVLTEILTSLLLPLL